MHVGIPVYTNIPVTGCGTLLTYESFVEFDKYYVVLQVITWSFGSTAFMLSTLEEHASSQVLTVDGGT